MCRRLSRRKVRAVFIPTVIDQEVGAVASWVLTSDPVRSGCQSQSPSRAERSPLSRFITN